MALGAVVAGQVIVVQYDGFIFLIGNERLDLARHVGADNTCVAGKCTLIGDVSHIVETFLLADVTFVGTIVSDVVPPVCGDVVAYYSGARP